MPSGQFANFGHLSAFVSLTPHSIGSKVDLCNGSMAQVGKRVIRNHLVLGLNTSDLLLCPSGMATLRKFASIGEFRNILIIIFRLVTSQLYPGFVTCK